MKHNISMTNTVSLSENKQSTPLEINVNNNNDESNTIVIVENNDATINMSHDLL